MQWNDCQTDLAKAVFSLIKYNNGFWKSYKQREFIIKQMSSFYYVHDEAAAVKKVYGISVKESNRTWCLEGEVRWADYGRRSYRRVGYLFAFDEFGITAQYKLHYFYDDASGSSSINPHKSELVWSRDESLELPVLEKPAAVTASQHVGAVSEWLETEVTIKSIRCVGSNYYGSVYQTRMVDNSGNVIIYWGIMKETYVADDWNSKVFLRAKVKAHDEYKGTNQTIVGYAKIKQWID